jgi:hypothetical protein
MSLLLLFSQPVGGGSESIVVDEIAASRVVLVGQTVPIDATEIGTSGNVDILLSLNNGSTFPVTIASNVTLPYNWVPTSAQLATQARLRIRDSADAMVVDDSLSFIVATTSAGGGSGGLTPEQDALLTAIAASLAGSPVEPTGRIANGGRVLAYVGDDFTVRSGTALRIPVKDPAGGLHTLLTSIGVENLKFGASIAGRPAGLITGTIASLTQSGSGASQLCNITVEITNCGVGLKLSEDYEWQIQSTQTHGDHIDTLIRVEGMLSLRRNVVG